MSKKRAGVEAALRLAQSGERQLWSDIEKQYSSLVDASDDDNDADKQAKQSTKQLELIYNDLSEKVMSGIVKHLTLENLVDIVKWKFSVGKRRPYSVSGNSEEIVRACSQKAIMMAKMIQDDGTQNIDQREDLAELSMKIQSAMREAMKLKGVGPATASAILSLANPHIFCYMYDEAIDCFENQRKYDIKQYVRVNKECLNLASGLGQGWTTKRVARALWIAARVCAYPNCKDLTLWRKNAESNGLVSPPAKRRKR